MTSNLDLMELAPSRDQDVENTDLIHVDLKAVLEAISAVNITACTSNGQHVLQHLLSYVFGCDVYLSCYISRCMQIVIVRMALYLWL